MMMSALKFDGRTDFTTYVQDGHGAPCRAFRYSTTKDKVHMAYFSHFEYFSPSAYFSPPAYFSQLHTFHNLHTFPTPPPRTRCTLHTLDTFTIWDNISMLSLNEESPIFLHIGFHDLILPFV